MVKEKIKRLREVLREMELTYTSKNKRLVKESMLLLDELEHGENTQ